MTCKEVADFLLEYTADELSPDVRGRFERHLSVCPNCREYLAIYRSTIHLSRRAFDDIDAIESGVPEELVTAILASRPGR
jgi:anti-sigma factor RsiW